MDPPFHCDAEGCTNPATRRLGVHGDLFVCDDHDPEAWRNVAGAIAVPAPSFTCPRCGRTSYHPDDIAEGYCGACHDWTRDDRL